MKSEIPSRVGKKSFQAFIRATTLARFRAACALAGSEQSTALDGLMNEYADRLGIPGNAAAAPPPPAGKKKGR